MSKTILITGSTDGIGLATANRLVTQGHHVLLHGRNPAKLKKTQQSLSALPGGGRVEAYVADLSHLPDVATLAQAVTEKHGKLDVLINNAGVFKTAETRTQDGLDVRFVVNTLAPYLLTQRLLPLIETSGRVINLSSAAQSPVDPEALAGRGQSVQGADRARVRLFDWAGEKRQTIWQAQGCATDPFSYRASAFFRFHENIKIPDTSVTSPVRVNTQL